MNRPPKNMISVTRNTHMPSVEASACCAMSSKWCWSFGWWACDDSMSCGLPGPWMATRPGRPCVGACEYPSDNSNLLARRVLVRAVRHDRRHREVLGGRRRGDLPLEPLGAPRVVRRLLALEERVREIDHRQHVTDRQHGRSSGRQHVPHLELRRIHVIPARHAEV